MEVRLAVGLSENETLLSAQDPPPVLFDNPSGGSPLLFVGDHAGNEVPAQLQNLGLGEADLGRHIGWDIGVRALGRSLAEALDATFIHQSYSRLAIDCNRAPGAADLIPAVSDGTPVPGNRGLDAAAIARRLGEIHQPYHAAIAAELDRRRQAGRETILVALHSFTPVMAGTKRPWHAGILFAEGDTAFALALLARLRAREDLCVGDNEPYRMDMTDYTIPRHAYPNRLAYAEIEIRQDLLADREGIARWCAILAEALGP
jgi:predicted N-formylglutamate amidohydrolase